MWVGGQRDPVRSSRNSDTGWTPLTESRSRARVHATYSSWRSVVLDDRVQIRTGNVNVATMHLAKGLEFRAVVVMACDDEVLPLQSRIEGVGDDGDLHE